MNEYAMQGRRVIFRKKPARIVCYAGDNRFDVLASDDMVYRVGRERLVFCR